VFLLFGFWLTAGTFQINPQPTKQKKKGKKRRKEKKRKKKIKEIKRKRKRRKEKKKNKRRKEEKMPLAGMDPEARARAHYRWAQRYAEKRGHMDQAIAHFGRALEYTRFGAPLIPKKLSQNLDKNDEVIIPGNLPSPVTLRFYGHQKDRVRLYAYYEHHGTRCSITLALVDAKLTTEVSLADMDPLALYSRITKPEQYAAETKALFNELHATEEPRSVFVTQMHEHETSRGLMITVLRDVFGFLLDAGALSAPSLVFYDRELAGYSFRPVDGAPSIMKTTVADFLACHAAITNGLSTDIRLKSYDEMMETYKESRVGSATNTDAEFPNPSEKKRAEPGSTLIAGTHVAPKLEVDVDVGVRTGEQEYAAVLNGEKVTVNLLGNLLWKLHYRLGQPYGRPPRDIREGRYTDGALLKCEIALGDPLRDKNTPEREAKTKAQLYEMLRTRYRELKINPPPYEVLIEDGYKYVLIAFFDASKSRIKTQIVSDITIQASDDVFYYLAFCTNGFIYWYQDEE
jgi:hypothetical protein